MTRTAWVLAALLAVAACKKDSRKVTCKEDPNADPAKCYDWGYSSGRDDGYDRGYDDGYEVAYQEGYDAALLTCEDTGSY